MIKIKLLIFIGVNFLINNATAVSFYISSSDPLANDFNNGQTSSTPWKTFNPLNMLATFSAVDTIFLKCGDTFRDELFVNDAVGLVITSYGTGNKPIISGADSVIGWTNAGNYYQAAFSQPVINFFADNSEQIVARYPDEGLYLTVDSATHNYLQDAALAGLSSTALNNSRVCVHTAQWCWEKSKILSSSGNQINYLTPTLQNPTANYGYFLYDDTSYLTSGKEWKYDSIGHVIYFKPASGNPDSMLCEASTRSYGIWLGTTASDIIIDNIAFEKQAESGIAINNASNTNILIDHCDFARQYKYAIDDRGRNVEIKDCYFREVDGIAVFINNTGAKAHVHHNTFRNIGGFRNSGIGQEINLTAITGAFVDSCLIDHNDIDSTGYCGISMDGKFSIIERNIIKNAMLLINDGAALKSFGGASQYIIFRNNFVSESDGNIEGIPPGGHFITPAIYFDLSVNNCIIQDNTVYNRTQKGIFLNSGSHDNSVSGNVIYGGNYLIDFNGSPLIPTPMTGLIVKHNTLFAKDPYAYNIRMIDNTGGYNQGVIDSNYYFQPYSPIKCAFLPPTTSYSFADWQLNTGFDSHSKSSFVNWTLPVSDDTLFMNQTDSVVVINLGTTKYLDLDSSEVCGSITLQPYTSKILISTASNCAIIVDEPPTYFTTQIYPNPASESVEIVSTDKSMDQKYLIDDLLGHTIVSGVLQKGILQNGYARINVSTFASGVYIVRIFGDETHTFKMVKK